MYSIFSVVWNPDDKYWLILGADSSDNRYLTTLKYTTSFVFSTSVPSPVPDTVEFRWNGSYWLAPGTNRMAKSADGLTWTLHYLGNITLADAPVWNGQYWLTSVLDLSSSLIGKSFNGINWFLSPVSSNILGSLVWNPTYRYWLYILVDPVTGNRFESISYTSLSSRQKVLQLHPLADIYHGPAIPVVFYDFFSGCLTSLSIRVAKSVLPDTFSSLRLNLINILKKGAVVINKTRTVLQLVNNVYMANISMFTVSSGDIIKFGLVQLEGRKRNKWYTGQYKS